MDIFGNDQNTRGCFMVFKFDTGSGHGAWIKMPKGGNLPAGDGSSSDNLIVVGIQYAQAETVNFVKTCSDEVFTYAYGLDPQQGYIQVSLLAMLGSRGGPTKPSQAFTVVNSKYKDSRVSQSLKQAMVTLGDDAVLKGFVIGMTSSTESVEHSIQRFDIRMAGTEIQ